MIAAGSLYALETAFSRPGRTILVDEHVDPTRFAALCRQVADRATGETFIGVALRLPTGVGGPSRLARLMRVRARIAAVERTVVANGLIVAGRYGVFPGPEAPTLIVELRGAAARYATAELVPARRGRLHAGLRWIVSSLTAIDPCFGGLIVVGAQA